MDATRQRVFAFSAIVTDDVGNLHVAWQEAGNLDPINGSARAPVSPADGDKTDIVHRVIDGETGAISLPLVISRQDDNAHVDDKNPSLATRGGAVVAASTIESGELRLAHAFWTVLLGGACAHNG